MAIIRLGNCSNWLLGLWIPPPVAHPSSRTQGDCPGGDVFAGLKPLDFATTFHGEFPVNIFHEKTESNDPTNHEIYMIREYLG